MTTPSSPDPAPDEPAWLADVRVPDDASALERDRQAWQREVVAAKRRARWQRVLLTRRWEQYGLSGPLVAAALAFVTIAALAVALLVPAGHGPAPRAAPLASPTVAVGKEGGLLPDVPLTGVGAAPLSVQSRALRPALVALIPGTCDPATCRAAMTEAERDARESNIQTWVVARDANQAIALSLEPSDGGGASIPEVDESGGFLGAYAVPGNLPTMLVVDATGVVRRIRPNYGAGSGGLLGDLGVTSPTP